MADVVHLCQSGVTHLCPPDDFWVTPCCGRSPFELPHDDRFTLDPSLVTCFADIRDLVADDDGR